jgi:hypothetical protein
VSSTPPLESPYKGLMPYEEEDAPFFFGRESEREIIIANLMVSRLTLLYGTSGVGKSSVLRAGVAHHLGRLARQNLAERGTPEQLVVVFNSWRDDPHAELIRRLEEAAAELLDGRAPPATPASAPTLAQAIRGWADALDADLLIILDQFEEYFLYHGSEDGPGTFAVEFPRAVNRSDLRVSFLTSMREDALARLDRFKGRVPHLFDNYLRVEHLSQKAARAAITGPLDQYNRLQGPAGRSVSIEPALVDAVLEEVRAGRVLLGESGRGRVDDGLADGRIETPYLQLVMTRLWEEERREESPILRVDTLRRLGGADRIVRTHLDAVMDALPPEEQDVAARVFHFLVTPSGTKITHTATDLGDYAETPATRVESVLDKLASGSLRILRPVAPPAGEAGPVRFEIFHDVLAPAILDWRGRHRQRRERAAAAATIAAERKRATRFRTSLILVSGVLILVLALAGLAAWQWWEAENAREAAKQAAEEAAESQELVNSLDRQVPHQRAVMRGHSGPVTTVAFNANGDRILTASLDGTAHIWDSETGRVSVGLHDHTGPVTAAAFTADWRITTVSLDGTAKLWDATTGKRLAELRFDPGEVRTAAVSSDGRLVASGGGDGTVRVLDVESGQGVVELGRHADAVTELTFNPAGTRLVSIGVDLSARV